VLIVYPVVDVLDWPSDVVVGRVWSLCFLDLGSCFDRLSVWVCWQWLCLWYCATCCAEFWLDGYGFVILWILGVFLLDLIECVSGMRSFGRVSCFGDGRVECCCEIVSVCVCGQWPNGCGWKILKWNFCGLFIVEHGYFRLLILGQYWPIEVMCWL
jgi:hypothetical protein